MNRRELFVTAGGAAAATLVATPADAKRIMPTWTPKAPGSHAAKPLPFVATALRGLSPKMITSHHDNNYVAAVKGLNKVEQDLAATTKDTPPYAVFGLRERELTYTNSMNLHERYFDNLGGDGKPAGQFATALTRQFGSAAKWEEQLRATAMALGGGSGWVVVAFSPLTADLRIIAAAGHNQAVVAGEPILVLDMFEHAYQMDFGAAHAKYIDAFFANLNWQVLDARLAFALSAFGGRGATGAFVTP